mmetsp:Transcript_29752/g.70679  ORF Transcript_29752/g.70679 Transcript_29752/m.70679 type:complete len:284 (+) Transcript_29752:337-1188(+)
MSSCGRSSPRQDASVLTSTRGGAAASPVLAPTSAASATPASSRGPASGSAAACPSAAKARSRLPSSQPRRACVGPGKPIASCSGIACGKPAARSCSTHLRSGAPSGRTSSMDVGRSTPTASAAAAGRSSSRTRSATCVSSGDMATPPTPRPVGPVGSVRTRSDPLAPVASASAPPLCSSAATASGASCLRWRCSARSNGRPTVAEAATTCIGFCRGGSIRRRAFSLQESRQLPRPRGSHGCLCEGSAAVALASRKSKASSGPPARRAARRSSGLRFFQSRLRW